MIKLEHVITASPEQLMFVIEGMRNPMNSWDKSDSAYDCGSDYVCEGGYSNKCKGCMHEYKLGTNDRDLMQRLSKAGTDHRKFMRQMPVYVRVTAPLYWWKEFETYRVGVAPNPTDIESNSCSTMHKIQEKEFTLDDFSYEHVTTRSLDILLRTINYLNECRDLYINHDNHDNSGYHKPTKKEVWWQMIQLLPSSYNQTRNLMLNYEVLANIYKSRKNHKLDEWVEFCKWIKTLPYSEIIIGEEK